MCGKYHKTYGLLCDLHVSACLVTSDIMHDECRKPVDKKRNTGTL